MVRGKVVGFSHNEGARLFAGIDACAAPALSMVKALSFHRNAASGVVMISHRKGA